MRQLAKDLTVALKNYEKRFLICSA
jgi:hypothetical protein